MSRKLPFSLILDPGEMAVLRKMANKDDTSVANVIRAALNSVIFKNHPDLVRNAIASDVDSFLDSVGSKLPNGPVSGQRRTRMRNQLVAGLIGKGLQRHTPK